ncbi:MAG TPA: alpha/beta hydrolase [Polyangia bacterium]|nr:alpha/beta hydrolase [Polyangia bacterium]
MKIVRHSVACRCLGAAALLALTTSCNGTPANAATEEEAPASLFQGHAKPAILLVHGAFADALGWQQVTALLQQRGYTVDAVENPLTSLATDVATTQRAIAALAAKGPLVVVGHSYGGMVISGAAVGVPQVKALVYINAFAPDPGQSVSALLATAPATKLGAALLPPDSAGFLFVDPAQFRAAFSADVSVAESNVAAVSQKPIFAGAFGETLPAVAWKTIPSWYLVGKQDQAINPDSERAMAKHIGAHTVEIDSSHVSFISHPHAVVELIEEAVHGAH